MQWLEICIRLPEIEISHLNQDHGGDLLRGELLGLTEVLNLNLRVSIFVNHLERPGLGILLDTWVVKTTTDQTPSLQTLG